MNIPGDSAVPNKINGVEGKPARIAPASTVNRRASGQPDAAGSAPVESDADVQLTGAARGMAALEQSVRALPAVDEARVAAVKQRLDDGSYEVDPQRVADRMLRLESDLQRGSPLDKNPQR